MLEEAGDQILSALNAEEAVRVAAGHAGPIHLLLTDVVMPRVSGRDLARQLSLPRPEMKILYMSGFTLLRGQQEFSEAEIGSEPGAPIILKPFTGLRLTQKVREVLDERPPSPFAQRPDPWGLR